MIDPVRQRQVAAWAFIFLIGLWLSQLFMHAISIHSALAGDSVLATSRDLTLLTQWILLFYVFFTSIYILQIPMLRLKLSQFILALVLVSTIQMLMFFPASPIAVRQVVEKIYWKSIERMEERRIVTLDDGAFGPDDVEFSGGISGSFTVKVIPYSLAELNPNTQKFCLPLIPKQTQGFFGSSPSSSSPSIPELDSHVDIPVLLSGVPPWTLSYGVIDYFSQIETNHSIIIKYASQTDALKTGDILQESKHKWHNIRLSSPGLLTLYSLTDEKGEGVVTKDKIVVSVCPEAFWKRSVDKVQKISDKASLVLGLSDIQIGICQGENITQSVLVFGVPPLSISYYHVKGSMAAEQISIQHIDSDYAYLNSDGTPLIRNLGDARAFVVDLSKLSFESPGIESFHIGEVTDGNGMFKKYVESKTADMITVKINERPHASLTCQNEVFVVSDENGLMSEVVNLSVSLHGKPPFKFEYTLTDSNGNIETLRRENILSKDFEITTDRIGKYKLRSVSDGNCNGSISSNECHITRILPPTIDIKFSPLESPCLGQVGFSASIKLTGKGPWTVWYDLISDKGEKKRQYAIIASPSETIDIKPPIPGLYTITFVEFRDSRFPNILSIHEVSATQLFHAPAGLLVKKYPPKLCSGSIADIEIKLTGKGPWVLKYDIVTPTGRSTQKIEITEDSYIIQTDPLKYAGLHYVEFLSLKDSSGCDASVKIPPINIEVVTERSQVFFKSEPVSKHVDLALVNQENSEEDGPISFWMVEGKALSLPFEIIGSHPPWTLTIEHKATPTDPWIPLNPIVLRDKEGGFSVSRPGFYRFREFKDQVCPGLAISPLVVHVKVLPKPRASMLTVQSVPLNQLSVESLKATAVCKDGSASMRLKFEGKPPFAFTYRLSRKDCGPLEKCGYSDHQIKEIKVNQNMAQVDLLTSVSGIYRYEALSVSDAIYSNVQLDTASNKFDHLVYDVPDVHFSDSALRNVCIGHGISPDKLPQLILSSGSIPAQVFYELYVEGADNQKQIKSDSLSMGAQMETFVPSVNFDSTGGYLFKLKSVIDQNKCSKNFVQDDHTNSKMPRLFRVRVSREPSFSSLSPVSHGCIGDKIGFMVQGSPPWTIKYNWIPVSGDGAESIHEIFVKDDDRRGWISGSSAILSYILSNPGEEPDHNTIIGEGPVKNRKIFIKFSKPGKMIIKEVCHGEKEDVCCIRISDTVFELHPVPFAKVSGGSNSEDIIRQGNDAKMTIEFKGTPPYSFTYSRISESGIELESHVVTNITGLKHHLTVNQAGKFVVTSISDKFCRYPNEKKEK